jgi:enterochelin esterase-like enzyme
MWMILILFLAYPLDLYPQFSRGKVLEGQTFQSEILGEEVRFTVYLPYDYDTSQRYYPVVYLLHGYTDNDMGWVQFGEAQRIADEGIANGSIPPMILAMPDGGLSWYINNFDGSVRYEDFFVEEFIPHIEATFRIRTEKRYRGVAGLSMGGYGSLVYALKHPDLFSACAAFSSAIYTRKDITEMPDEFWQGAFTRIYGPDPGGEERITEHLLENNPIHIIQNARDEDLKKVRYYIDCGDDDFLYRGNSSLHILLRDRQIPHEYRVRDGGHQWSYWRGGLLEGLAFIGTSFHQP